MPDMKKTDRSNVDFGALLTLRTVHELGSFSLAAKRLAVKQSTVSYTIDRLRRIFGDPLFVQTAAGIQPTERCGMIAAGAARLLERYDELVMPKSFDPATAEFVVTFAMTHQKRALLATRILASLRRAAPGVRVRILQTHHRIHEDLLAGNCDILISAIPYAIDAFRRKHLLSDRLVCVVDRDHPRAGGSFTFREYSLASHILVRQEESSQLPFLETLDALGLPFRCALDLPSTSEIEHFILGTDLVATVMERTALTLSEAVALVQPPFDHRVDVQMYWTARTDGMAQMSWIRDIVARVATQSNGLP